MAEPRFRFVAPDGRRGPWRATAEGAVADAIQRTFGTRGATRHERAALIVALGDHLRRAGWRIEADRPPVADDG